MGNGLITIKEAAELLGVGRTLLNYLQSRGRLRPPIQAYGRKLYPRADILKLREERESLAALSKPRPAHEDSGRG